MLPSTEWWRCARNAAGMASRHRFRGFRGRFRDDRRESFLAGTWRRAAVTVRFSVTVRQVREDRSRPRWTGSWRRHSPPRGAVRRAQRPGPRTRPGTSTTGSEEKVIGQEGRELQRRLLQATFDIDSAREEQAEQGHQRRRDPARHRGRRPWPGRDQRVRAGPGHPEGIPQPPRAEPGTRQTRSRHTRPIPSGRSASTRATASRSASS